MSPFDGPRPAPMTLRALAALLTYPDARLRDALPELHDAIVAEGAVSRTRTAEIAALLDAIGRADPLDAEADYVQLFDRGRATSLHLFEHVHGDSRDRGPAMIDLAQTYAQAGLELVGGELPDFLPVLLEFASTQPPREARALLSEVAHILQAIFTALVKRESRYASVLGALLELAGEKAQAVAIVDDEPMDAAWAEPPAFDGCASAGQARPATVQPIHVHRDRARAASDTAPGALASGNIRRVDAASRSAPAPVQAQDVRRAAP
ncbi:MAG: nitrate reductase molybdenum cofactor assembly chaperone [Burkholderiales bacterium]|nr:nitrate reductase molybdenum cofactor assembly chaperone [Burkholderiales bacterium]